MDFRDDRAVSELLGAILLFGLLISLLIIVQATAVPNANEQVEFQHSQQIQGDMLQLADDIDSVAVSGSDQLSVLNMGVRYPNRFLLFNPPAAAGTLAMTGDASFTITNARAEGEVGDYWDGSATPFDSQSIVYRPNYNVYQGAPDTRYESGIVVNAFDNGNTNVVGGGTFIDGNRINLIAVQGSRDVSQSSMLTLDVVPLAAPSRTVSVEDTGTPITITITTELPATRWETILDDQLVSNGGNVQSVAPGATAGTVDITLAADREYRLRLASVGVGGGVSDPPAHYVTTVTDRRPLMENVASTEDITVEVRDRYNNPVGNAQVTFSSAGGTFDDATVRTNLDGQATATFSPSSTGTKFVTATINGGGTARERAVFTVTVGKDTNDAIADEWINSGYNTGVLLGKVQRVNQPGKLHTDLTFENTDPDGRTAIAVRLAGLYSAEGRVDKVTYDGVRLSPGGQYVDLPTQYTIASGGTTTKRLSLEGTGLSSIVAEATLAIEYENGDISRYNFETEDEPNRLTDAERVAVASVNSVGVTESGMQVTFVVTNGPRTVTDIKIEGTSNGANTIDNGALFEVTEGTGLGRYDGTMNVGTSYTLSPSIGLTNRDTITVQQFRTGGTPVNMGGETVTFTLTFADGSKRTYTVSVP